MTGRTQALVVFDLDGTLVDSSSDLAAGLNAMLQRLDRAQAVLPLDTVRSFIGNGARHLVGSALRHTGREETVEEALPVFLQEYRARLLDTTRLYPGMEALLDRLHGRSLAVLTNKPGDLSRALLQGLGLSARFFRIYGGGDLATRKPDPEGLQCLLAEAGVSAEDAVMVGDSGIDVRTARAAGVRAVAVSYGFDPESLVADPPDVLAADVPSLAAALGA